MMLTVMIGFYCAQGPHCGKGMTFSINPTAERTQAMFQAMAIEQNGNGETSPITGGDGDTPAVAPPNGDGNTPLDPPLPNDEGSTPPDPPLPNDEGSTPPDPPLPNDEGSTPPDPPLPNDGDDTTDIPPIPTDLDDPTDISDPSDPSDPSDAPDDSNSAPETSPSLPPLSPPGFETDPGQPVPGPNDNTMGGIGSVLPDGSCSCAVAVGAGAFPAVGQQGVGNFGGMPGSLPAEMAAAI